MENDQPSVPSILYGEGTGRHLLVERAHPGRLEQRFDRQDHGLIFGEAAWHVERPCTTGVLHAEGAV
eukprot:COSAG03_NODE_323_length_8989_cov_6.562655_3_plen_67_part_00